jgi:DNA repair protein RecO (recombination protein O)
MNRRLYGVLFGWVYESWVGCMNRTYKATGINLKAMPMGESDRLITVLTREFGLLRLMAMGARKHQSKLGGRSGLFVVNELMIAKGRSLDKITQAETLASYPGLARDLKKLTAGQYLAELALHQALDDHPQEDLFYLLNEQLAQLERSTSAEVLAHLVLAIFQLLSLAGVAPQVHHCCMTQVALTPDFSQPDWRVGFNAALGGTLSWAATTDLQAPPPKATPKLRVRSGSTISWKLGRKLGRNSYRKTDREQLQRLRAIGMLKQQRRCPPVAG